MPVGKIVVFANQKGGVGKTTTAINVGAYLAEAGKQILLVDLDPQGNLSSGLGAKKNCPGSYELLNETASLSECIQRTPLANLSIISSNINLVGATVELTETEGREFLLKKALGGVRKQFDYVLIDCPPSLGLLTVNGFSASDVVIVPLQCEFFSLEGFLSMLFDTIKRVQKQFNRSLRLAGVVFTMYDSRTRLGNEVIQQVKHSFKAHPSLLFKTIIPRNVRLSEAPSHRLPINLYDRNCMGARSYESLTQEVLARV